MNLENFEPVTATEWALFNHIKQLEYRLAADTGLLPKSQFTVPDIMELTTPVCDILRLRATAEMISGIDPMGNYVITVRECNRQGLSLRYFMHERLRNRYDIIRYLDKILREHTHTLAEHMAEVL